MTATIISAGIYYARIEDDGKVKRLDIDWPASDTWRITGAVRFNNFGYVVERFTLADILDGRLIDWKFKNGKQRVFLTDLDHGHPRVWGSPQHSVAVYP